MKQKEVWNTIADSWSNLKVKPDREAIEFAEDAEGSVLDVGCGNCRNLLPFLHRGLKCAGIDFSKSMIKQAKKFLVKRNFKADLVIADVTSLPFKNNSFSNILYIRTLSTVATKESRLKSLREIKRTGNNALITAWKSAWKKWQLKFIWNLIKNRFSRDMYVDWNYHGKVYKRFYHFYTKNELKFDLKLSGFKIEYLWENKEGNICAVVT